MSTTPQLEKIARQTSSGVFHAHEWGLAWGEEVIDELKSVAATNSRRRARLCMQPLPSDPHQEMLIVMSKEAVERAQRRTIGFDTKIVLSGRATLRYFDETGEWTRSILLGGDGGRYVHTRGNEFHALTIESDWFVFLEILTGPFDARTTEFATWS